MIVSEHCFLSEVAGRSRPSFVTEWIDRLIVRVPIRVTSKDRVLTQRRVDSRVVLRLYPDGATETNVLLTKGVCFTIDSFGVSS